MKYFDWNDEKNIQLRQERDVCFEDVLVAISDGKLLDVLVHPNATKYPNQKVYVLNISGYVYLVPFVDDGSKIFLKTIYPSRKLTKAYLLGGKQWTIMN